MRLRTVAVAAAGSSADEGGTVAVEVVEEVLHRCGDLVPAARDDRADGGDDRYADSWFECLMRCDVADGATELTAVWHHSSAKKPLIALPCEAGCGIHRW